MKIVKLLLIITLIGVSLAASVAEKDVCLAETNSIALNNSSSTTEWFATAPDGSISTFSGIGDWVFTFSQIGAYLFTATDTSRCNPDEFIVHVHALPPPIDSIQGPDSVCASEPIEYSIEAPLSGVGTSWIVEGATPNSGSGPSISVRWNPAAPLWRIACFATSSENPYCSSDTTWKIIYPRIPNYQILGPYSTCENSYETYHEDYGSPDYYKWSIAPSTLGSVSSGDGTNHIQVLWNNVEALRTAMITCEMRVCNIVYFDTQAVVIHPTLDPSISIPSICAGQSILLHASTADAYEWMSSLGRVIGSNMHQDVHYVFENDGLVPINIPVSVWVTNPGGCPGMRLKDTFVTVPPNPGFSMVADDLCDGSATLRVSPNLAMLGAVYTFRDEAGTVVYATDTAALVYTAGRYSCEISYAGCTYLLYFNVDCIGAGAGCSVATSGDISEHCGEITVTGEVEYCTATPWYSWTLLETGEVQNTRIAVFKVDRAGTYHFRYNVVCDGCNGKIDTSMVVPMVAKFELSVACREVHILNESSWLGSVPTHVWDLGRTGSLDAAPIYTIPSPDYDTGGAYVVHYTISDGMHVCMARDSLYLPPLPIADFIFPNDRCQKIAVPFTDISSGWIRNWFWDFDDGATVDGIENPERVFDVSSDINGIYRILLTITDQLGCVDSVEYDLNIEANLIATFGAGQRITPSNSVLCNATSILLGYDPGLARSPTGYFWSTSEITSSIIVANTGSYLITVTDNYDCVYRETPKALVEILHNAAAKISGKLRYCEGEDIFLHSVNAAVSYSWEESSSVVGTTRDISILWALPGLYIYKLTTTDLGCSSIDFDTIEVFANPVLDPPTFVVNSCSPYAATITGGPIPVGGNLNWNNMATGSPILVGSPGLYNEVLTDMNHCKTSAHIRLPDPPTAIEFPEGCMRLCDTLLPLTVPMSIAYDAWKLFHDGIAVDSGMGVPTFRITGAGSYYLELTKDICTITTGALDVDIIDCAPCDCKLFSLQIDTLKDHKENCIYHFWNRSMPNHCYQIDSTLWSCLSIGRMGKGDSLSFTFPADAVYDVVVWMYLSDALHENTCLITDTIHIKVRDCKACSCTINPHIKYTQISNNPCCVLIEDTSIYTVCAHPIQWQWRIDATSTYTTTVPYIVVCDSTAADSFKIETKFWAENTATDVLDTCIAIRNNYKKIYACSNGRQRRGLFADDEFYEKRLTAYPSPFQDLLHIRLENAINEEGNRAVFELIKIYDMQGKMVYLDRKEWKDELYSIELSILANGVYEMQVIDELGNRYRVKLVKSGY